MCVCVCVQCLMLGPRQIVFTQQQRQVNVRVECRSVQTFKRELKRTCCAARLLISCAAHVAKATRRDAADVDAVVVVVVVSRELPVLTQTE